MLHPLAPALLVPLYPAAHTVHAAALVPVTPLLGVL